MLDKIPFNVILGLDETGWLIDVQNKKLTNHKYESEVDLIVFQKDSIIPSHYVYSMNEEVLPKYCEKLIECGLNRSDNGFSCVIGGTPEQEETLRIGIARGLGYVS